MLLRSLPFQKLFVISSSVLTNLSFFLQPVAAGGVTITNYGHSSLLIEGGGLSVLLNPFKAVGCASGLSEPRNSADVILASSELLDEGARIAKGKFLVKPGSYRIGKTIIEGFSVPHDRFGGRRFGDSTLWSWNQSGIQFAHLGGVASSLSGDIKVSLGSPDVLIIGVGGGAKVFNAKEAVEVIRDLNPKRVIPVQYVRESRIEDCDQEGIQPFLDEITGIKVNKAGNSISLSDKLKKEKVVYILD